MKYFVITLAGAFREAQRVEVGMQGESEYTLRCVRYNLKTRSYGLRS